MDLSQLIELFGTEKQELDNIKKTVDGYNKSIKEQMNGADLKQAHSPHFTVTLTEVKSEGFDEGKLIQRLTDLGLNDCIKMVATVDMSALENAIYNGQLNPAKIADCKVSNVTQRLTIKKNKEA